MIFDLLVKQRLRNRRVIDFAMPVPAISDKVDNDIGAESITIFCGKAAYANHRVHVLSIHVEDRNRLPARNARRETRRMLLYIACSESQQIIDNDVNCSADGITWQVSVVHGFSENALPGKSGI